MAAAITVGYKHSAIDSFITAHFTKEPVESQVGPPKAVKKGKAKKKAKHAQEDAPEDALPRKHLQMYLFKCKTCDHKGVRDFVHQAASHSPLRCCE